ncbi:MAG: FAD binding domain-containing protein [Pseudomonadota bacterium]
MLVVETVATAAEAAGRLGQGAQFLGGGTLVMRDANFAKPGLERIVRTADPSLARIEGRSDAVTLGAGVTMADIIASRETAFLAPVAAKVGGPAVRNMATVGGNLFAPHPYGDLAVALLALDGRARMADGAEMALADLLGRRDGFRGVVESVTVRKPSGDDFRFRKVSRVKPKGVSVLSMAAWLPRSAGRVTGARVAYGAMGPAPMRVAAVEGALEGVTLDASGIAPALAQATQGLSPPEDALASAWYRAEVAPVHLRRLLLNEAP